MSSPEFDAALAATVATREKADGIKSLVAASRQAAVFQHRAEVAEAALARVRELCTTVIDVHDEVVMDTPEDRELHDRAIATFRAALEATS